MGNFCSQTVTPDDNNTEESHYDEKEVKRRVTKGAGVLGKTDWTDDEDEEEEECANSDAEEIIGELPMIKMNASDDNDPMPRQTSRVTLINRPQCLVESEVVENQVTVTYLSNIPNSNVELSKTINREIHNLAPKDRLICLYSGDIAQNLKEIKIDAAISESKNDNSFSDFVLMSKTGCQFLCKRKEELIGILAITDIDDEGKWLEFAKIEADKMNRSEPDPPHMIIALTSCDVEQAKKLAKICVSGVKVILCRDQSVPSSEQIVLGTPLVNLNPSDKKIGHLNIVFDEFHQVECKPTKFLPF